MPANTRAIKGRIKSIKNTSKITKAMEMVAAAKMRKAVQSALDTRSFSKESWDVLRRIVGRGSDEEISHSLLDVRSVKNMLVVLVTSNRGLVGGLNSALLRDVIGQMKEPKEMMRNRVGDTWLEPELSDAHIDVITVGKKGERAVIREGFDVVGSFGAVSDTPEYEEARPIAKMVRDAFVEQKYDKVVIAYNDFISAINQKPRIRQLLPVSSHDIEKMIAQTGRGEKPLMDAVDQKELEYSDGSEYVFEPSKQSVLDYVIPKVVNVQVYQALLEAAASEHSARMVAMKSASDAAKDLIDDLQFTFNQLRQAGITAEIAEISAGKAALE